MKVVLVILESYARELCEGNTGLTCKFEYKEDSSYVTGQVISYRRTDISKDVCGPSDIRKTYISQDQAIIFTVCSKGQ